MAEQPIRDFDVGALHAALDAQRRDRELSWAGVARQIWDLSSELNERPERRADHPISPSTLTNMARQSRTSCQHALFMLRWLGRTPESFLAGAGSAGISSAGISSAGISSAGSAGASSAGGLGSAGDLAHALPAAGPDRRLRWSLKLLYAVMDEKRRADGLTWPALATLLGCTPSQLTGLRTARFATGMGLAMRVVQWVGRPAADFVYPAKW